MNIRSILGLGTAEARAAALPTKASEPSEGEKRPMMVPGRTRVPTTRWSRVLAAADSSPSRQMDRDKARSELCCGYWYPLYAILRRRGNDHERACDLTQAFFLYFFEKNLLAVADPERGRFRSLLLKSLKNFVANTYDAEKAWKAGGRAEIVSIDENEAEGRYGGLPAGEPLDEVLFDHAWMETVIKRAMDEMRARCRDDKAREILHTVTPLLPLADTKKGESAQLAAKLSMELGAFKTRLSRLREQFWGHVRKQIAETLDDPNDVDEELRHLIAVLGVVWRT